MSSLTEKIGKMIEEALPKASLGEDFEYDVSMTVMPGPGNQPMPMLIVTFACKAVTIGEWHSGCIMMQPALPQQDDIDTLVQNSVKSLLDIRTQHAAQALASSNGHGKPDPAQVKGLIYPGS